MEFEHKDFMSMSDEDFAYETNLTREKVKKSVVKKALEVLMDNGNLFFKDYEGKVSPISYCNVDNGKIIFME